MIQQIVPRDETAPCMTVDAYTLEVCFFTSTTWDVTQGKRPPSRFTRERWDEAKAYCDGCPWRLKCLEVALEWEVDGVWGGTDPVQRHRIRGNGKSLSTGSVRHVKDAA